MFHDQGGLLEDSWETRYRKPVSGLKNALLGTMNMLILAYHSTPNSNPDAMAR